MLTYDYDFKQGQSLLCCEGYQGHLTKGMVYHFERYGNHSTIHLKEHKGLYGRVGWNPERFELYEHE